MNKYYITWCLVACSSGIMAQSSDLLKGMTAKYPDEATLLLERTKTTTLEMNGDSLRASADVKETVLFLKDLSQSGLDRRIYGSHFMEVSQVEARSMVMEKNRYKTHQLGGVSKKKDSDNSIFYDDSYFYELKFPAQTAGNKVSWSYAESYRDPRFLPTYFFAGQNPIETQAYMVRAAPGVDLDWRVLNDEENLIQFNSYVKDGFTYYVWTAHAMKPVRYEEDSPKWNYIVPQVLCFIKSYNTTHGKVPLLSGPQDLANWYAKIAGGVDTTPSDALNRLASELIDPNAPVLINVKKVFYWVQDHIRYIAFEDGMRGLVPHPASYVLEKRYGDCKDMASLIIGILKTGGITSYYTWIGTRDLPYQYTETPTPMVDNHMIATYISPDHEYYYLDGTSNYTPFGLPSSMIQGKEALIIRGDRDFEIKTVPTIPASASSRIDSIYVRLADNQVAAAGQMLLSGYQKIEASYDLDRSKEIIQKENIIDWLKTSSNKVFLDSFNIENLHDKDAPLKINYQIRLQDYAQQVGDEIYINLNLDRPLYNQYIPKDRRYPIEHDYQYFEKWTYALEIPKGYQIEYQPQNTTYHNDVMGFTLQYEKANSLLMLHSQLQVNTLLLKPDHFESWNRAIDKLTSSLKDAIILKSIKQK